jgi:hypothetical protein
MPGFLSGRNLGDGPMEVNDLGPRASATFGAEAKVLPEKVARRGTAL